MSTNRRKFLKQAALGTVAIQGTGILQGCGGSDNPSENKEEIPPAVTVDNPVVVSTWNFGIQANDVAWNSLSTGAKAIDAVEQGVMHVEKDPNERSVGYGGRPDRDGKVTLDACIMDEMSNIGSVAALEHIKHPISVARAVMEKTPHVMLVGEGALQFAIAEGFKKENLLTEQSRAEWKEWLKTSTYKPIANIENHDTIGMIALDAAGNLSGACTTSGMAFKMHGRVGDSPIIGAGLFVDNEVGAATATGHGEEVIRVTGSFLVVELMRQGYPPQKACEEAVARIKKKITLRKAAVDEIQIGFIALNKQGDYGAYCLQKGFNYAVRSNRVNDLFNADYLHRG